MIGLEFKKIILTGFSYSKDGLCCEYYSHIIKKKVLEKYKY
jgi:hypothetical protein